ncbi:hypothetical protein BC826DRAFT_1082844, partial [Russula brevipes]
FLTVLKRNPQISYIDLLRGVRCVSMTLFFAPSSPILRKKYGQKPQLSSTHPLQKKSPREQERSNQPST